MNDCTGTTSWSQSDKCLSDTEITKPGVLRSLKAHFTIQIVVIVSGACTNMRQRDVPLSESVKRQT